MLFFVGERADEDEEPALVGTAFQIDQSVVLKFSRLSDAINGVVSIRASEWHSQKDTCQAHAIICLVLEGFESIEHQIKKNFVWDP